MIKKVIFLLIVFSGLQIFANAIVQLEADHTKYIMFEPMKITVRIRDNSSYPLVIDSKGGGNAVIRFNLIDKANKYLPLPLSTKRSFVQHLSVGPGKTGSFSFDLTDYYVINNIGDYQLKAILEFGGKVVQSNLIRFEISNGMILSTAQRLLPGYMDRTRDYSLRYIAREGNEEIFLRVDEVERSVNYGVFPLGRFVRVFAPELSVDLDGFVKVRYQVGYNCYCICYFLSEESGVEYVDRAYVTRDGMPYDFSRPANDQGKKLPTGSSVIKSKKSRSLWQRITGQGKEESTDESSESSVPKTKSNVSDVPSL